MVNAVEKSEIANLDLLESGIKKMQWASDHMPVFAHLRAGFLRIKPLENIRVGICLHLEAKTACLAELFKAAGAEVYITGSNPLSTQDDVCAALVKSGVVVYARHNPPMDVFKGYHVKLLEARPQIIIDDGADLIGLLHDSCADLSFDVIGACEETTTGILRAKVLQKTGKLRFPVIAVNDAKSKCLFDNRYGTGQSVWDNINVIVNLISAGKQVVVVGYGWCGKGVAKRARGLGAKVIICEVDPIRAVEAHMEGFMVLPMVEAAKYGDIFVTVTGNKNVIAEDHFAVMRDGAILANAGHFDIEIDLPALDKLSVRQEDSRDHVKTYFLANGKRLHLLASGRLVNLAAGDGHPAEIMDMSFSLQMLSALYLLQEKDNLEHKVINVPDNIDQKVSSYFLSSVGITIDTLTPEQQEYLSSWVSSYT